MVRDSQRHIYEMVADRSQLQPDSDILRLNVLGTNIILANSFEVATDLLEKRSSIYSDR